MRFRFRRRRDLYAPCMNSDTNTDNWGKGAGGRGVGTESRARGGSCTGGYDAELTDRGNEPVLINLPMVARRNDKRLRVLWTGENMQLASMTLPQGGEVGLEVHEENDQLIEVIEGVCEVEMGTSPDRLTSRGILDAFTVAIIPAGTYHNLKNRGKGALRLVSVYAPKEHPYGAVR